MADTPTQLEKFPRRTQRRLQTRETILKAATKLFRKVGYGGATMNAIAEAADVHVTTLFTHFKTKQDLAVSLNDAAIDRLARLIADAKGKTPFFEFYRELVLGAARKLEHKHDPATSVWRELGHDLELTLAWAQYERRQIALFADYIAFEYGLDPDADYRPELIAGLLLASAWAAHRRSRANPQTLDLEAETTAAVSTAIEMGSSALERSLSSRR
jgi:AcrR family transcriptional regulator